MQRTSPFDQEVSGPYKVASGDICLHKILVVDDSSICREPIAEALRGRCYDVRCAASGEEALRLLTMQRFDVVLLDMSMPGLDGLAVLRTIRSNRDWRSTPVIMLTDKADRDCITGAASHKIQGYLLKSNFSLVDLFKRIEACLAKPPAAIPCASSNSSSTEPPRQRMIGKDKSPSVSTTSASARHQTPRSAYIDAQPLRNVESDSMRPGILAEIKPLLAKEELRSIVTRGLELRPLGTSVHSVMAATSANDCSVESVAKAVLQDQVLSIRLLKLANSSAYSRGRPVESVKEAVQRVGISELRSMVMALGVLERYEHASCNRLDPRLFWEHSIACGLIASAIAKTRKVRNLDEYFLWGILHDIGRLIIIEHVPEAYAFVWDTAEHLDVPLETVEPRVLSQDHCDILQCALEHWQFPREFFIPVVNHHRSVAAMRRLGPEHCEAAATIALADRIAHVLLLGSSSNDVIYPFVELIELLSLTPRIVTEITARVSDETRSLKLSMLARADEKEWPDRVIQIRSQLGMPLRPLYLTENPTTVVVRTFLDRIASETIGTTPNLAIASLDAPDELSHIMATLDYEERKLEVSNLPLLILTGGQRIEINETLLRTRRCEQIRLPFRVVPVVRTIQEMITTLA